MFFFFGKVKIAFYLVNTMSEDVETQRKGIVVLMWFGSPENNFIIPGTPGSEKRVIIQSGKTMGEAIPARLVAMHFWLPNTPLFRLVKSFYAFQEPLHTISRFKFHIGKFLKLIL